MTRQLLPIPDAASALGVSERHIKQLIEEATRCRKSRSRSSSTKTQCPTPLLSTASITSALILFHLQSPMAIVLLWLLIAVGSLLVMLPAKMAASD